MFCLSFFQWFFPQHGAEGHSVAIWVSLSFWLSPLWYLALRTLVSLASVDSELELIDSGRPRNSIYLPFPCSESWEYFQVVPWYKNKVPIISIPYFRDHSFTLPIVQCLKTVISYNFFVKKSSRVNVIPWVPSWPEMEVFLFLIFKQ